MTELEPAAGHGLVVQLVAQAADACRVIDEPGVAHHVLEAVLEL